MDLITIDTGIVFYLKKKKKPIRNSLLHIFVPLWKRIAEVAIYILYQYSLVKRNRGTGYGLHCKINKDRKKPFICVLFAMKAVKTFEETKCLFQYSSINVSTYLVLCIHGFQHLFQCS